MELTITEAGALLRQCAITATSLTTRLLDRIEAENPRLNAFITICGERALADARAADRDFAAGIDRGPLQGIPIALKDNIATKGIRTTCGSKLYQDWVPDADATVATCLHQGGAVLLGKTGMHELAYGTTSINPFFGRVANPAAVGRDPGGSSGGSAAAVAAGLAFAALGTDTACSIRYPAHCCGITGFKPSYGLVSNAGVIPLVRSLDHVGPFARTAADAALVTSVISGSDRRSRSASSLSVAAAHPGKYAVSSLRLGIGRAFFFSGDPAIMGVVDAVLDRLKYIGASFVDLDAVDFERSLHLSRMAFVEAYALYADRLATRPDDFSAELRGKLGRYTDISAKGYIEAWQARAVLHAELESVFDRVDVIVAPTASILPAPFDNRPVDYDHHASRNATVFNLSGQPSISIPCGWTPDGMPVGLMLSGRHGADAELLAMAYQVDLALRGS